MHHFTPVPALIGGLLVGLAAALLLFTHGHVAGISGIYGGLLRRVSAHRAVRAWFLVGLVLTALVVRLVWPAAFASSWAPSLPAALAAGVLVGFGTRRGNGCTSGHGVCGVSRFSSRSLAATLTFMATGMITVFVVRHVLGGGR